MLDLAKAVLPSSITVGGRTYKIKTWYKLWIRFLEICRKPDELKDFDFLFQGEIPEDKGQAFMELQKFASPEHTLPRPTSDGGGKVIDYTHDSRLIYAAFMQFDHYCFLPVYRSVLRSESASSWQFIIP